MMLMMMKLKGLYWFCFLFFVITANLGDASRLRQLKKNIIKSIKSQDGDVIDCVDISHQPAFDHPMLQNHTIKMKPSGLPEGLLSPNKLANVDGNEKQITQLWQLSGECPEGSIPIRRTDKQATPTRKNHINIPIRRTDKRATPTADVNAGHEYAYAETGQGNYYGAKTIISAWQPYVERSDEFSLSQIWVAGGTGPDLNTIEVGWIVEPQVFGDCNTRLFVYWTSDYYQKTGCYNLLCSGFIQTDNNMALGGTISKAGNQPEITLLVWKDAGTDAWWLEYNGNIIGYWPNSLFTNLGAGGASSVAWGGEIINSNVNGVHTATQMGSGRFAQQGFGKASYFRNLEVVNDANTLILPADVQPNFTNRNCYNIAVGKSAAWGNFFYYGGPGKNRKCP